MAVSQYCGDVWSAALRTVWVDVHESRDMRGCLSERSERGVQRCFVSSAAFQRDMKPGEPRNHLDILANGLLPRGVSRLAC
jgi:hypothetical protein